MIPQLQSRFEAVRHMRSASSLASTREFASLPYRFVYLAGSAKNQIIAIARVSSISREYLPADILDAACVPSDALCAVYDPKLWNLSVLVSTLHRVWVAAVCGKLKTDYRYSNTLGWNTFPVPTLTEQNAEDLTQCALNILLARESYWPATIADMYDPKRMDTEFPELRAAHDRNDEVLERIYIGRRFKNDTERLEKLFEMYTKMIEKEKAK